MPDDNLPWAVQQEGRAVAGNHRATQGTGTESLHLILEQHSE